MPLIISGTDGLSTAGTAAIQGDSAGRTRYPNQVRFLVNRTSDQSYDSTGASTVVIWNNAIYNTGNHYNTSTGLLTIPVTGFYGFSFSVYSANSTTQDQCWYIINGGRGRSPALTGRTLGGGTQSGGGFDVIRLTAGDTIGIHPYMGFAGTRTITANTEHTWWRGVFLG